MIKFKTKSPAKEPLDLPPAQDAPVADHEPLFQITDFPENHVLYHIHKNGTRTSAPRHHNVVHASDLDPPRKWCAREAALLTMTGKKRKSEFTSTAQRMVWQMGYKGADLVMNMIPRKMQWGSWKCLACKQTTELGYAPDTCPYCDAHHRALEYQEVVLRDPVTGVVGSVDLFVDILGNGAKTAIEIKTEGNDSFKARSKPEFEHEWRTMLYLRLASASWDGAFAKEYNINTESARIIYVTKEGYADSEQLAKWKLSDWKKSAMKEYIVNRNDDMINNQMEYAALYRQWRIIWDDLQKSGMFNQKKFMETVSLPPRVDTAKAIGCTRCKNCIVKQDCWPTPDQP